MSAYVPSEDRYQSMTFAAVVVVASSYLRCRSDCGRTSVMTEHSNAALRLAGPFDLGITHFDLANNYGPPYGSAEENFGRVLREDFSNYRDELVISTKAGWDMWPGPYGDLGSRKYLLASLDQSLRRLGVDYVDIYQVQSVDATPACWSNSR